MWLAKTKIADIAMDIFGSITYISKEIAFILQLENAVYVRF